jgi:hypothetical protein
VSRVATTYLAVVNIDGHSPGHKVWHRPQTEPQTYLEAMKVSYNAVQREARIMDTIELRMEEESLAERFNDPIEAAQVHKVRENRARRMAVRQGLVLMKSRRREPRAIDFGGYMLVDENNRAVAGGNHFDLNLEDVEEWLLDQGTGGTRT